MIEKNNILSRLVIIAMLLAVATFATAQRVRPSTTVIDKEKYAGPTKWSCIDKHYGYYFLSYAMPIPINKSNKEIEGMSGKFRVGYMYRYKVAKPFDIGVQLNYLRQSTGCGKYKVDTIPSMPQMKKLSVIENSIECGAFMRFNFGKSDFRHLGWHIDLGANYSYDFTKTTKLVNKFTTYTTGKTHVRQKTKIRDSNVYRHDFGIFMRIGWNYIALTCEYSFDGNAIIARRSPLMLGLQINMYTR